MATQGGCIDFMFLAPSPYPAAGPATVYQKILKKNSSFYCYFGSLSEFFFQPDYKQQP